MYLIYLKPNYSQRIRPFMAASLHFFSAACSFTFITNPPNPSLQSSQLPLHSNYFHCHCMHAWRTGGGGSLGLSRLRRRREGGAISSLIEGPNPKRYLGDDYVVKQGERETSRGTGKSEESASVNCWLLCYMVCPLRAYGARELEMLAVEYEDSAMFVKVNTDDEYEFARDMQASFSFAEAIQLSSQML